jgi:hypothetical protein
VFQTRVEISRRGQTVDGRISGTRGERAYFRPAANVGSLRVSDLMSDRCQGHTSYTAHRERGHSHQPHLQVRRQADEP